MQKTIKNLISLLLTATMLLSVFTVMSAQAAEVVASGTCGADGDNLTWTLDEEGTLIISGNGEMSDYSYNTQPPYDKERISKIVIGDGVTHVGNQAFRSCSNLREVSISESVNSIGDAAFMGCYSLPELVIPNGVEEIGNSAFNICFALSRIVFGPNVKKIGYEAFEGCFQITHMPFLVAALI